MYSSAAMKGVGTHSVRLKYLKSEHLPWPLRTRAIVVGTLGFCPTNTSESLRTPSADCETQQYQRRGGEELQAFSIDCLRHCSC